jgi:hypothetical protein
MRNHRGLPSKLAWGLGRKPAACEIILAVIWVLKSAATSKMKDCSTDWMKCYSNAKTVTDTAIHNPASKQANNKREEALHADDGLNKPKH